MMSQAVQIETQAELQSLAHLHRQAAAWSASRELAFGRREHALNQSAATVEAVRKFCRICARPPWMRQVLLPRLAGITLCAPSC